MATIVNLKFKFLSTAGFQFDPFASEGVSVSSDGDVRLPHVSPFDSTNRGDPHNTVGWVDDDNLNSPNQYQLRWIMTNAGNDVGPSFRGISLFNDRLFGAVFGIGSGGTLQIRDSGQSVAQVANVTADGAQVNVSNNNRGELADAAFQYQLTVADTTQPNVLITSADPQITLERGG